MRLFTRIANMAWNFIFNLVLMKKTMKNYWSKFCKTTVFDILLVKVKKIAVWLWIVKRLEFFIEGRWVSLLMVNRIELFESVHKMSPRLWTRLEKTMNMLTESWTHCTTHIPETETNRLFWIRVGFGSTRNQNNPFGFGLVRLMFWKVDSDLVEFGLFSKKILRSKK